MRASGAVFSGLIRVIWKWALAAALLTLGLEVLAVFLRTQEWAQPPIWLPLWESAPTSLADPLLLGIVQVGAVVLGLFFATVGVVASTVYADAPQGTRKLFVWERGNRVYALTVAASVVAALTLLAARLAAYEPTLFAVGSLTVLAAFMVLALVVAAPHTLAFFDPLETTAPLLQHLDRWASRASSPGVRSTDATFQNHYRTQASILLSQLEGVAEYARQTSRSDPDRFGRLARDVTEAWRRYSRMKLAIPRDSFWYERKYTHPRWDLADHHRSGIAIATRTPLTPDQKPDHLWVEAHMSALVGVALHELLKSGKHQSAVLLLTSVGQLARELLGHLQYEEYLLVWNEVTGKLQQSFSQDDQETAAATADRLALVDAWAAIPVESILGLEISSRILDPDRFSHLIKQAMATPGGIYEVNASAPVLERLERSVADREIEIVAEGHTVSPLWFTTQIAARDAIRAIHRITKLLIEDIDRTLRAKAAALAADLPDSSAIIISRGVEACHKLDAHLPRIATRLDALSTLEITPDDRWPTDGYDRFEETAQDLYRRFINTAIETLRTSSVLPATPELPDLFGQLRSLVAEELFRALLDRDSSLFAKYFSTYLATADQAQRRAIDAVETDNTQAQMIAALEPWLLAFELSGYALFFTRLDGTPFWEECERTWNALLEALENPSAKISAFTRLLMYRDALFGIAAGDVHRTSRTQRFEAHLRDKGVLQDTGMRDAPWHTDDDQLDQFDSLTAVFLEFPRFHDMHDLFLSEFLLRHPAAQGVKAPRGVEQLRDSLQNRERHRPNDTEDGHD